jgi:hypothetical protein
LFRMARCDIQAQPLAIKGGSIQVMLHARLTDVRCVGNLFKRQSVAQIVCFGQNSEDLVYNQGLTVSHASLCGWVLRDRLVQQVQTRG